MWRHYPYLQNPYTIANLNEESEKRKILSQIDNFINQRQYVKMTLLDWQENPLKSIEGEIESGSMSKDGASAVRCTCSLNCSVDGNSYSVDDMDMDFTLNKKIFIEIGIKNETDAYPEFPIFWFPQGVFFITNFVISSSSSSAVNISINLKDKMAMLNGELGGTFPNTIRLDAMDTQVSTGEYVEQKVLVYHLIGELLNHWGNEDLNNIIIEDIPLRVRKLVQWDGKNPIYSYPLENGAYKFTLDKPTLDGYITYEAGMDLGYIFSDFVLPNELYANGGDTVASVLDQIKNILGNYEYFYDEFGLFHFREIKNYINSSQAQNILEDMDEKQYLIETTNEKTVYSFSSDKNIVSINVNPRYENIKNDYIVHGLDKGTSNSVAMMIMYHLVIDEKPEIGGYYKSVNKKEIVPYYGAPFENVFLYTDPDDMLNKLGMYTKVNQLPESSNGGIFYYLASEIGAEKNDLTKGTIWYWSGINWKQAHILERDENNELIEKSVIYPSVINKKRLYYAEDYRTFLYLSGLEAQKNGTETNRYFQELNVFWPAEYNLHPDQQDFYGNQAEGNKSVNLSLGKYYLDFIDEAAEIGQYSISAIGCRSDVVTDDNINCLFAPNIPDVIFINIDDPDANLSENTVVNNSRESLNIRYEELFGKTPSQTTDLKKIKLDIARRECQNMGYKYTQVKSDIYDSLIIGGLKNPAFDTIQLELFYHTNYQKTVSLTTLPVYYLSPNSRVSLNDKSTNTYGDYMIQNLSFSFGPGANMTISLNEIHERI